MVIVRDYKNRSSEGIPSVMPHFYHPLRTIDGLLFMKLKKSSNHLEIFSRSNGIPMSTLISLVWQQAANFFSISEGYHPQKFSRMKYFQGRLTETLPQRFEIRKQCLNFVIALSLKGYPRLPAITFWKFGTAISMFAFFTNDGMIFVANSLLVSELNQWMALWVIGK